MVVFFVFQYFSLDDVSGEFLLMNCLSRYNLYIFIASGHIAVPPILALHDSYICEAGDGDKLESLCGTVQELDLTKNCITDWGEVKKLV